jgi:hypothetical protein
MFACCVLAAIIAHPEFAAVLSKSTLPALAAAERGLRWVSPFSCEESLTITWESAEGGQNLFLVRRCIDFSKLSIPHSNPRPLHDGWTAFHERIWKGFPPGDAPFPAAWPRWLAECRTALIRETISVKKLWPRDYAFDLRDGVPVVFDDGWSEYDRTLWKTMERPAPQKTVAEWHECRDSAETRNGMCNAPAKE